MIIGTGNATGANTDMMQNKLNKLNIITNYRPTPSVYGRGSMDAGLRVNMIFARDGVCAKYSISFGSIYMPTTVAGQATWSLSTTQLIISTD